MFVRVRDPQTRHQFDLREDHRLVVEGWVEVLTRFPRSRTPRPPKPFRPLGAPAPRHNPRQ